MPETILANATLVLPREIRRGSLVLRDGLIAEIDGGTRVGRGATDCEGDIVAPGLVELHTDNLERHIWPRPGVEWPRDVAIIAHDGELASVGITTVFDSLRVGSSPSTGRQHERAYARDLWSAIAALRARGALRIDHRLHLRAEICCETLEPELDAFGPADGVGLVSVMDHTPGARQFRDLAALRRYAALEPGGLAGFEARIAAQQALGAANRDRHAAAAVAAARRSGAAIASHDDTTRDDVALAAALGARIAEFPTTLEAAAAARARGIFVMMGAPNLIRGGSHAGNVAARDLAEVGLLDVLSSDYVPAGLLHGAFALGDLWGDLARGIAAVTATPAAAAGLDDRGVIAPGARADLVRVARPSGVPVVRATWVGGHRVA
jgi:alpha-D-ribose 1-methylphosphonate 5-triphosphate diphosphatase